jgi:hypothetical protein
MNSHLFLLVFYFASCGICVAGANDSLYNHLINNLKNRNSYEQKKENSIDRLKQKKQYEKLSPLQIYDLNTQLYEEYRKYQMDSAMSYVSENQQIAQKLDIPYLRQETDIKLAWLMCARGMFIESSTLLENINVAALPRTLLSAYYDTYCTFCSNYAQSSGNVVYYTHSERYRDSLLLVLDSTSMDYKIAYAAKQLYSFQSVDSLLLAQLKNCEIGNVNRGIITYYLGYYFQTVGEKDLSEKYYLLSAISDVENSIKDNASQHALALIYYADGQITRAQRLMQAAIDDAVFCNARFRTAEISSVYPFVYEAYKQKETQSKRTLQVLVLIISILLVSLIVGLIFIVRQMRQLTKVRNELYRNNLNLSDLNRKLTLATHHLNDSNLIKEEYIANFFDMCSAYIEKLDDLRKTVNKYIQQSKIAELKDLLHYPDFISKEREKLFEKFDLIFLHLYPTFTEDFNALQNTDGQISVKHGMLNTELRIFALIRLGITDSTKIAGFLRLSISTIYNYRVKARNNAVVSRDGFDKMLMATGNSAY